VSVTTITMPLEEVVRPFGVHDRGIRFVDGSGASQAVSYDELAWRAACAARSLSALGLRGGEAVGVALDTTPGSVALCLGAWMAGACVVSLPPPRRREQNLYRRGIGTALRELGCRRVFGGRRVAATLAEDVAVHAVDDVDFDAHVAPPDNALTAPGLVQFSSGSTGVPQGIALSAASIARHVDALGLSLEVDPERDSAVSWLPLHHDMGFVGFLLTALRWRIDLVLASPQLFVGNPSSWLDLCARHRATLTGAPNFGYRVAARVAQLREPSGPLDHLRVCLAGAELISWNTLEEFAMATAGSGLRWESLVPVYGLAEATLAVSMTPLNRGPRRSGDGRVTLGFPLSCVELELRPCAAAGSEGRIALRGPCLLDHYVTVDGPQDPRSDGWFDTSDIGHWDDGELVVHGRADETVIVAGRNVCAEDVELVAVEAASPAAKLAGAFRWPADGDGFGLAIEVAGGSGVATAEIAEEVQRAVEGAVAVRPSPVLVLTAPAIPRTTSGKVRRADCRRLHQDGAWPTGRLLTVRR
jgi:acyl-CoA synthetase (AMP-forming)/AMP-acid ligase II